MKSNKMMWVLVGLIVITTMTIAFGTLGNGDQALVCAQTQPSATPSSQFGDFNKFPTVDYDAVDSFTAAELEQRKIKNKRYKTNLDIIKNPDPDSIALITSDGEQLSPAIPFVQSKLVIVGDVLNLTALLSDEKKEIYSEYSIRIKTLLKEDKQKKLQTGETIIADRAGGVVRYPSGQKILYRNSWHNFPETNTRYIFFLGKDDDQNPNYKILTAYRISDEKINALDNHPDFTAFNGMAEKDFIDLIVRKK